MKENYGDTTKEKVVNFSNFNITSVARITRLTEVYL